MVGVPDIRKAQTGSPNIHSRTDAKAFEDNDWDSVKADVQPDTGSSDFSSVCTVIGTAAAAAGIIGFCCCPSERSGSQIYIKKKISLDYQWTAYPMP